MDLSAQFRLGQEWRQRLGPFRAPPPTQRTAHQALRLLALLRILAPLAQAVTLYVVTEHFRVQVPTLALVTLVVLQLSVAAVTFLRLGLRRDVGQNELMFHAMLDVAIYTGVLYLTGGTENPFAPMFVLPMVIVASALEPRRVWVVAVTTMLAYVALRSYHVQLVHPDGDTHVYSLHEDGMVVNYVIAAALLAYFCNGMHASMRRSERLLADARDAQMRNESVVAIGALAAGYAHELGSPLSTVAVVTTELRRQFAGHEAVERDLGLIAEQIAECKRIVSRMASAGGERRAETAGAARLDQFIEQVVERARSLNPGATISATIGGATAPPMIVFEETLGQAIMNLIQNAAQASPDSVTVDATWDERELRVEVRDRGPGFRADILERLGRRIETTKGVDGIGLGLVLSVATLERLGGQLDARNEPGGGAYASIRIPLPSIALGRDRESRHAGATG